MPGTKKRSLVINLDHCGYGIVHRRATHYGWHIAEKGESYDILFTHHQKCHKMIDRMIANPRLIQPVQRINHLFNNKALYNKGIMGRNLNNIARVLPKDFDFHPRTFQLPADLVQLREWHTTRPARADAQPWTYIIKPCANMQGKGIRLSQDPAADAEKRESCVVQDYIADPLLLDGFKFDLRIYLLVLSVDPLEIHVYNDGLARLCTTPYVAPTGENIAKTKMHLTNFAINKKSKKFNKSAAEDEGSKRSIASVMDWLDGEGVDTDVVWARIVDLMTKTIIMAEPQLTEAYRAKMAQLEPLEAPPHCLCYEIFGFDVMLDEGLKPWIIEINHAPCFGGGTKLDTRIKVGVIGGAFRRLGVSESRKAVLAERVRKHWQDYTMQQAKEKAMAIKALKDSKAPPKYLQSSSTKSTPTKSNPNRAASSMSMSTPASPVVPVAAGQSRPQTSAVAVGTSGPLNITAASADDDEWACIGSSANTDDGDLVGADGEALEDDAGAAGEVSDDDDLNEVDGDDEQSHENAASDEAKTIIPWLERKVGYSLVFDQRIEAHYEHYRHIFEAANKLLADGQQATGDDY